jgi:hypothetical protein
VIPSSDCFSSWGCHCAEYKGAKQLAAWLVLMDKLLSLLSKCKFNNQLLMGGANACSVDSTDLARQGFVEITRFSVANKT